MGTKCVLTSSEAKIFTETASYASPFSLSAKASVTSTDNGTDADKHTETHRAFNPTYARAPTSTRLHRATVRRRHRHSKTPEAVPRTTLQLHRSSSPNKVPTSEHKCSETVS